MIGSFLTRALALTFGYAYPAYECFKTVELNKPEIEQLRFWCQYWILVAALTVFERVGDAFISWLPMYSEAKVVFFVYLWYPRTKGTTFVYETFLRPYVAKHEIEIDRNLLELRTRVGDMVVIYSQRITSYGQTRFFEILQYIASQSTSQSSRNNPSQFLVDLYSFSFEANRKQENIGSIASVHVAIQPPQSRQPPVSPTAARQTPPVQPQFQPLARPPAPPLVIPTKNPEPEPAKAGGPNSSVVLPAAAQPQSSSRNSTSLPSSSETTSSSTSPVEAEPMQVEVEKAKSSSQEDSNPPPPATTLQETSIVEAMRITRGRLRRRAATAGGP